MITLNSKLARRVLMYLMVAILPSMILCSTAFAVTYDDFNGSGIDPSRWLWSYTGYTGSSSAFSQSSGFLNYSSSANDTRDILAATQIQFTGAFKARASLYDFYSSNTSPWGQGLGSAAGLAVGVTENNAVYLVRGHNGGQDGEGSDFIQIIYKHNGDTPYNFSIGSSAFGSGGMAGFYYDGHNVQAYMNAGYDPNVGWIKVGAPVAVQDWNSPATLFLIGKNGPTGEMSFKADNVVYSSVPVPASLLLFGPGLIGLAALRKKFRK